MPSQPTFPVLRHLAPRRQTLPAGCTGGGPRRPGISGVRRTRPGRGPPGALFRGLCSLCTACAGWSRLRAAAQATLQCTGHISVHRLPKGAGLGGSCELGPVSRARHVTAYGCPPVDRAREVPKGGRMRGPATTRRPVAVEGDGITRSVGVAGDGTTRSVGVGDVATRRSVARRGGGRAEVGAADPPAPSAPTSLCAAPLAPERPPGRRRISCPEGPDTRMTSRRPGPLHDFAKL